MIISMAVWTEAGIPVFGKIALTLIVTFKSLVPSFSRKFILVTNVARYYFAQHICIQSANVDV